MYFRERERQSTSGERAEREEDTKSETGSRLQGVSTEPDAGLEPSNHEIMTRAQVRCLTDWATQVPLIHNIFKMFYLFWERERDRDRDRAQAGEGQREMETQNLKQAPGSEL